MYLPALPALARDLGTGTGSATLTVAVFFLGMAAGQLIYGPLSDRVGRRPPLLIGTAVFVAGSIACALAPSLPLLLAARLLTSIGACAGVVVARAVVRDHFGPQESARVFSRLVLVMGVSPILSPLAGGLMLKIVSWRAIFWLLAAVGAAVFAATLFLLAESRSDATARRAAGEQVIASFRAVLAEREVVAYILTGAGINAAVGVYVAASSPVLIGVYGVRPEDFGWVFGINGIGYIGASQLNARLLRRHSADTLLRRESRMAVLFSGVLLAMALSGLGGLWGILLPLFCLMSTLGFNMPNAMACALARDPSRAGSTSALIGAGQFGISMVGAIIASAAFDHSARPMAAVIFALVLAGAAVLHTRARPVL